MMQNQSPFGQPYQNPFAQQPGQPQQPAYAPALGQPVGQPSFVRQPPAYAPPQQQSFGQQRPAYAAPQPAPQQPVFNLPPQPTYTQQPPQRQPQQPPAYRQPQQFSQQPAPAPVAPQPQQPAYTPPQQPVYAKPHDDAADAKENMAMGMLSYLGILWLVPLVSSKHKESPFTRHHLNQGLVITVLWACAAIAAVLLGLIRVQRPRLVWGVPIGYYMVTPWWVSLTSSLLFLGVAALAIIGLISAISSKSTELPIIGKIKFFK